MTDNDTTWLVQQLNDEKAHVLLPTMIFLGVLMATGVIGNALVIFYYGYRAKTTTGTFFILSLAVFDFLASAIGIPIEISDMMFFYTFENVPLCKTLVLVNHFSIVASAFTLCAIAVDRYRRIVKPFDRQISMRQAKITCTVCIGLGVALSWPASIFYGVVHVDVPNTDNRNLTGFDCTTEKDPALKPYALVYSGVQFVGFGGVAITLVVAYLLVGRQLYRHRQYRFYVAQRSLRTPGCRKADDTVGSQTDDSTEPQATTLQSTDNDTTIHPSPDNNPFDDKDAYVEVEYEGPDFGDSPTPQPERIPDFSELLGCLPGDTALPEVETSSTPTRAFGFLGLINGKTASILTNLSGRSTRSIVIWNISDDHVYTTSDEDIANARNISAANGDTMFFAADKSPEGSLVNLRQVTTHGSVTNNVASTTVRMAELDTFRQSTSQKNVTHKSSYTTISIPELANNNEPKQGDNVNCIPYNSDTTTAANVDIRENPSIVTSSASSDYRMRTSSTSSASANIKRARRDHNCAVGSAADDSRQTDIHPKPRPGSSSSVDSNGPDDKRLKMLDINTVKYTVIMLIIAAVFILSMMPYLGLWWVWRIFAADDVVYTLSDAELVWLQIGIRSYFINGAVNPLIYGLFNSQFRAFLYNGVCGVCFRKQATLSDNKNSDTNSKDSPGNSGTDTNSSSRIKL